MSFGQPSGPPASAKQVRELLALLEAAGHSDFRDARGPMGFTQRQAGGKFSRDEAQAFIDQLENDQLANDQLENDQLENDQLENDPLAREAASAGDDVPRPAAAPAKIAPRPQPTAPAPTGLRAVSDERLVAELRRRGWRTIER